MDKTSKKAPANPEAAKICDLLQLERHPAEFGWYKQLYKSSIQVNRLTDHAHRSAMSSIYFLQESGAKPLWRQLKSDELFCWVKGSPVELHLLDEKTGQADVKILGDILDIGKKVDGDIRVDGSQFTVSSGLYFNTDIVDPNSYGLVICVVSPGFDFDDFRLAPQEELHAKFPNHKPLIDRFF